ncbi:MAG: ImmA/IrrE family metallo-endopeptidase [Bacteroidota bacterium]|nr:ImmA/IrrE family metallo-endopeptidase [Bacteroidota bacterium]
MVEIFSKKEIEKIALDILVCSSSLDVFPTPVDNIIQFTELTVKQESNLTEIDFNYSKHQSETLKSALSKIQGILDREEKLIYIDKSLKKEKKNFVKLHEVGHDVLPWQKSLHTILQDDENSLSEFANEEFEGEANYFASAVIFQLDRFNHELDKLDLSLNSAMKLSKFFGASVHSAIRRYIECSKNRCALLVLENVTRKGEPPFCYKRDYFQSPAFTDTFGTIPLPTQFGYKWNFTKDYYHNKKIHDKGEITLPTENGDADFNYHFFNNTYNAFVFFFPYSEKKSPKIVY